MKNTIRFTVVAALLAITATAHAQSLPSSGSSDLWLFVSDQAAGTTFAEDTGIALNSLLNTFVSGAQLNSTANLANFTFAPSPALTSYIATANAAGDTLEWAVLGVQFRGQPSATVNLTPGSNIALFDAPSSTSGTVAAMSFANLKIIDSGFQNDVEYLDQTYLAGGAVYNLPISGAIGTGAAWGAGSGDVPGSVNLYGQGPNQSGVGLGESVTLYGVTADNNRGTLQSYVLSTDLTLGSDGTLSAVTDSLQ